MSDPLDSANKIIEILNQHTHKEAARILHAVTIQISEYVLTARYGAGTHVAVRALDPAIHISGDEVCTCKHVDPRAHAGLGLACDICPGACTIDL